MQRLAFKMKLKPGCETEYEKRHARLWPEMKQLLKEGGIGNYSIFYDPDTLVLFAYQEIGGVRHHLDEREVVAACFPDGAQARPAMAKTEEDRGNSLDFS